MNTSLRLPVTDISQAGEARRRAAAWTRERGCGTDLAARVALVVTELATNLALHTSGGALMLRNVSTAENCGVEILSLDAGPGVANFTACLRDGHSTRGTAGTGLGAVHRASEVFEVHSQPGKGTALLSEIWAKTPQGAVEGFACGSVSVPLAGEELCGDAWASQQVRGDRLRLIVADGVGHGHLAAAAARKAVEIFFQGATRSLTELLEAMHVALRGTRGAAVAIAEIDREARHVSYIGVGNIAAAIVAEHKTTNLVSHNGTIGAQCRRLQQFTYPWTPGASLVMQSDGLKSHWNLEHYLGLTNRHPGVIAGVLHRDHHRTNDDSTVVVVRARP